VLIALIHVESLQQSLHILCLRYTNSCSVPLLANAAHLLLPVYLLGFKIAFFNGPPHEEIYVIQLPGFTDGTLRVWLLHRALYGSKQVAHAWHQALVSALEDIGFRPSQVDPATFVRNAGRGVVLLHTHVDDCAGTGPPHWVWSDNPKRLQRLQRFEGP
jgi:hypothetical protein